MRLSVRCAGGRAGCRGGGRCEGGQLRSLERGDLGVGKRLSGGRAGGGSERLCCDAEYGRIAGRFAGGGGGSLSGLHVGNLLSASFPPPVYYIDGILPVGLSIMAGRPKLGKSYLALQMALAVHCGGMFLGRKVSRARALYLALEDSEQRLASRLKQLVAAGGIHSVRGGESGGGDGRQPFCDEFATFSAGGIQVIEAAWRWVQIRCDRHA